jgi:hypothetical protein
MRWLDRLGWWLLVATAVLSVVFGLGDLASGTPDSSLAVTGQSAASLQASSPAAYDLIVEEVRTGGIHLVAISLISLAVLLFGFRRNERWAWWTMWLWPVMTAALAAIHFTTVAPGQSPAVPAYSGSIVAALDAVALLVTAPRFFRRPASDLTRRGSLA